MQLLLLLLACDPRSVFSPATVNASLRATPDWYSSRDDVPQVGGAPDRNSGAVGRVERALLVCAASWPAGQWDAAPNQPAFWAKTRAADPVLSLDFGPGSDIDIDGPWNTTRMVASVPAVSLEPGDTIDWEVHDWDVFSFSDYVASGRVTFSGDRLLTDQSSDGTTSCWLVEGSALDALAAPREQTVRESLQTLSTARAAADEEGFVPEAAIGSAQHAIQSLAAVRGWDDPQVQQHLALLEARESQLEAEASMLAASAVQSARPLETAVRVEGGQLQVRDLTCGSAAQQRIQVLPDQQPASKDVCVLELVLSNTSEQPLSASGFTAPKPVRANLVRADGTVTAVSTRVATVDGQVYSGFYELQAGQHADLTWSFEGPADQAALELRLGAETLYLRLTP